MDNERRYCFACFHYGPALNCWSCLREGKTHAEWRVWGEPRQQKQPLELAPEFEEHTG